MHSDLAECWQDKQVQQFLITLEIVAGATAILALAWTVYTAFADAKEARHGLLDHTQVEADIVEANARVDELKKKGEWLRIQGKDEEAKKVFAERQQHYTRARTLSASLEQPRKQTLARDVLFTRRVVNRAILTGSLTVVSIISGTSAGAFGAAESPSTGESSTPSPSTSH
jgi:hypothetical protein